jgi:hypothetical protein
MDDAVLDDVLGRSSLDAAGHSRSSDDIPAGGIPLDRDL